MRSRDRGSAVGFVIVGVVLTALLLGGIVLARNLSGPRSQPVAQTPSESQNNKSDEGTQDVDISESESDKKHQEQEQVQKQQAEEQARKNAAEQAEKARLAAEQAKQQELQRLQAATSAARPELNATAVEAMPQTGSSDDYAVVAAVTMLAAAGAAYWQSRRAI